MNDDVLENTQPAIEPSSEQADDSASERTTAYFRFLVRTVVTIDDVVARHTYDALPTVASQLVRLTA